MALKLFVFLALCKLSLSVPDPDPDNNIHINVQQIINENYDTPLGLENTRSLPKVVIDTDAGIDDAEAIFMVLAAHKRGELEVVGITTVNGNTGVDNVTSNVLRILETAGLLQIPVYNGSWTPLVRPWSWEQVEIPPSPLPYWGYNGFGDVELPSGPSKDLVQIQPAAAALVEIVKKYEGYVTLLEIGPSTNFAIALRLDPHFIERLASLYIVGGNTEVIPPVSGPPIDIGKCGEFNFYVDPESARVVLENTINTKNKIHLVPAEFCFHGVNISCEYQQELRHLQTAEARLLNLIQPNCTGKWITYDQLAAAWMIGEILNEDNETKNKSELPVTKTGEYYATVKLEDLCRGHMVIDHDNLLNKTHNLIIIEGVNVDIYKNFLKNAYGESNKLFRH